MFHVFITGCIKTQYRNVLETKILLQLTIFLPTMK